MGRPQVGVGLLAVRLEPVRVRRGYLVDRNGVQLIEEAPDARGVLVDVAVAADQRVADVERISRDMRKAGNLNRQPVRDRRQQEDLLLELFHREPVAWDAQYPPVFEDQDLEVEAVVDLDDRRVHAANATLAGGSCCCGSFSSASRLRRSACPWSPPRRPGAPPRSR